MNFCSQCAAPVTQRVPVGDNRLRFVCDACATIHYHNPRVIAGCIPQWGDQVLLCRRAIEPRKGYWTLPAGFMENGETTAQGAARETMEEANARVHIGALFSYLNIPRINQVYVMFLGKLLDLDFSPGDESTEVELFREDQIPSLELAFPAVELSLQYYFEDLRNGDFGTHVGDIHHRAGQRPSSD